MIPGQPITNRQEWEDVPVGSLVRVHPRWAGRAPRPAVGITVLRTENAGPAVTGGPHLLAGGAYWSLLWEHQRHAVLLYRHEPDQQPLMAAA